MKALIVDDHPVFRTGLAELLGRLRPGAECAEAGSAAAARRQFAAGGWDLVLLDLDLPDGRGLDLLAEFGRTDPGVPVLIVSMHGEEEFVTHALRRGAAGYLSKADAPDELAAALDSVARDEVYLGRHASPGRPGAEPDLTPREMEVLGLLARGHRVGEVAALLEIDRRTVSTHRRRVFEKMGWESNHQLTAYALRRGLVG